MSKTNVLTLKPEDARKLIEKRRKERTESLVVRLEKDKERREAVNKLGMSSDKQRRVFRALLKSGHCNTLFEGFNGEEKKWSDEALSNPDEWAWVRAKYGVIGVPYPDGSEFCFAPGVPFPLHLQFFDHIHETMNGEVRTI